MNILTPFWTRTLTCGFWLVAIALFLVSGCAHSIRPATGPEPTPGVCTRSAADLALAVREQSQRFEICTGLTEHNRAGEYVLGFVATPSGEPVSVMLLGADLEPLGGEASACFATVVEDVGLARSGGGECPVTVPLIVSTRMPARELPAKQTRDADGWLVSAFDSAPAWAHP